jgi:dehydrogenase
MRTAVIPSLGARWQVREVATPEPGLNEVLIRVRASGLCYSDVHVTQGILPAELPRTVGHEPVGEIVAVGPGVASRRMGDRVGVAWLQGSCGRCEWCQRGKASFCEQQVTTGVRTQGGHAEYMVAAASATTLLPDGLPWEQAAPIFCAGYTVWSGLRLAEPKPGERVAVVGIGGLGHLALQYAKAAGFETFAVSRTLDKEPLALQLGADEVVAGGRELQAAGGADVILATSNSYRATSEAVQGLRPDGRLVLMGLSGEPFTAGPDLVLKRGRILGSIHNGTEYLYEALDHAARGRVKVVAETYPLDKIGRAYDRLVEGKVRFRAVILP